MPVYLLSSEQSSNDLGGVSMPLNFHIISNNCELKVLNGISVAHLHSDKDSDALIKDCQLKYPDGVDILLSNNWPEGVEVVGSVTSKVVLTSSHISALVAKSVKPRYHFTSSASSTFWEREPFRNGSTNQVTRFLSLGAFGNKNKQRYFYAFNLKQEKARDEHANTTDSPYAYLADSSKRSLDDQVTSSHFEQQPTPLVNVKKQKTAQPPEGYVCNICHTVGHFVHDCPEKVTGPPASYVCKICNETGHYITHCPQRKQRRQEHHQQRHDSPCWFCLSNPDIAKHLILSVGDEIYLSLPKGELVPGHVLIVSIDHVSTSFALAQDSVGHLEIEKYKLALRTYFAEKYDQDIIMFETNIRSVHMNIQVVPVHKSVSGQLRQVYDEAGASVGIQFQEEYDNEQVMAPFYRLEFPSGDKLIHFPIGKFNIQFGREVLADFLGLPDRRDWKACVKEDNEEMNDAETFKHNFKEFDFTMA